MSHDVGGSERPDVSDLESGIEGLYRSPDFRGPGEPLDDHDHSNDHLALIYESRAEQFASVVPFLRQGLERGEQCLYVADENSREDVLAAMGRRGVDVDAALDSGALRILTPAESYRRTGAFDRDAMLSFWEDALERATDEEGYEGVRATAEMTWALDDGMEPDKLVEYEALLNPLYEGDDYVVLCQYNRERFPAEVVRDVVETHPHVIVDNTVSRNVYYTPPEKFFGPEEPAATVDRMVETLRDRTETKTELQEHKAYLRELYETTANGDLSFEETVERLLELGCERFDLRGGALARLPNRDGKFRAEVTVGPEVGDLEGELPVQPTDGFCRQAIEWDEPTAIPDVAEAGWGADPVFREFGFGTYFGIRVTAGTEPYGTFWFYDTSPRDEPFTDDERAFLELMGQWVSNELERTERERFQRRLYEIAADTERSFDEKLQAVLELGRERFELELGGLARIDPDTDRFVVEATSGDHDALEPGADVALSETYCRVLADGRETAGITDPEADGFAGSKALDEFGVRSYLGTRIGLENDLDRTFFFVSSEPREEPFSEAERTFHRLMGQWVKYELEHRRRERELEETVGRLQQSNDRLKQFAYAASHDLQEPLRMVSSYLQLLENQYGDELDAEAAEYIEFAVDGAERMRAMVDDLLAYSRVERADGEFERVDCDALVERVTDDLRVQIQENGADVVAESLPTVRADGDQLEQLFRNLVSNGIKYNESDPPRVEVDARRRADCWEFTVTDNGIGIDPDRTDRIFEVFKRLHHDEEYTGTGIGLSLCQEIVENHGGEIRVESDPGEGSTFSFTLPARAED